MRRWWKQVSDRVNGWLQQTVRQRVTRAGMFFTMATALVGVTAFLTSQNLLFLLLAAMLSTLLVSGFISRLGLAALELELILPQHILARQRVEARFVLSNRKLLMPSFALRLTGMKGTELECDLYFPVVPSHSSVEQRVMLEFPHRGAWSESTFVISSRFPFGFTERRVPVTLSNDILVYPSLQPQAGLAALLQRLQGEMTARHRGRGSEYYRHRQYEPRESTRHIDWKATARTGQVQVREFAQDESEAAGIFLDLRLADPKMRKLFEQVVEASAYLVYFLWKRNGKVRLRSQEFDQEAPEQCDLYAMLKYLALVQPKADAGVPTLHAVPTLEIAVTTSPERFLAAGWPASLLAGPDELATWGTDTTAPDPAADPDFHHSHGTDQHGDAG